MAEQSIKSIKSIMSSAEFKEHFNLDPAAKGVRATPKRGSLGLLPEVLTADGKPFDATTAYYHFDGKAVISSQYLKREGAEWLGSLGMKIVEISKLRADRDDAIEDAQKGLLGEIWKLREKVRELEDQKRQENRSMKAYLMAGKVDI